MTSNATEILDGLSASDRARLLQALKRKAVREQAATVAPRSPEEKSIPLSLAQRRLWLLHQLRPGTHAYNEVSALRLAGRLDVNALERSVREIVRRHEALRTVFSMNGNDPVQVVTPWPGALEVVDLTGTPRGQQESAVEGVLAREGEHAFDLASGPLFRTTLVRMSDEESLLVVAAHHIVLDGWSIGVFQRELAEHYRAFRGGGSAAPRALPIQYGDYALWQRHSMRRGLLDAQLAYWTEALRGLPPLLQLPFAAPRPEVETFRGARRYFSIDAGTTERLVALARRENVSLFMILLAAFQALLGRYTARVDVPVGTAVANRNPPEVEELIGFFVNTLVMRGDLSGDPTFRAFLGRVREMALAAFEHQDLPFEALVEKLNPERSPAYNPLFQVMFLLQNAPERPVMLEGITAAQMEIGSVTAKYDLTLSVERTQDGLRAHWEYSTDLFDEAAIDRMSGHLTTFLGGLIENPDLPLSEVPLLTERERHQIVEEWNRTEAPFPLEKCIHELIEAQVARTPGALAIDDGVSRMTYAQLNDAANQLAHYLRGRSTGSGDLVGICLERSVEFVVALLAVLKAGAGYVPLDPSYPRARLLHMLDDAKVRLLVTRTGIRSRLPSFTGDVVDLEAEAAEIARLPTRTPTNVAGPETTAYVVYTSGSTGKPKGVEVTHRNLVHSTSARWEYYREPVGSFLLLSPFAFDSSVAGVFWTLTQGGTIVLPADVLDVSALSGLIASRRVTHLLSVPSLYTLLLQRAAPGQLSTVRTAIVAGESCPTALVREHRQRADATALYNEYGPSEATVWCTVERIDGKVGSIRVPIGRPIANAHVYVLDSKLQPVPVGVPGELHVGGAGVARGYLGRPDLTAGRFIRDPFASAPGARLYKTGDLARFLPDGAIEFLGRIDNQVKIRGHRVELEEVEAALLQHPSVREAVAMVHPEGEDGRLLAYVVTSGSDALLPELRGFVAELLPTFAVPSELVRIDVLPRSPNGKVDRAALPAPETLRARSDVQEAAGWTELQRAIATIWQETLKVGSVGLDDNFFQVGGDSLRVVRVFNRLGALTRGKKLSITDLFKHPTIRGLSAFLERQSESSAPRTNG